MMTPAAFDHLQLGDTVRVTKTGKVYKVTHIDEVADDTAYLQGGTKLVGTAARSAWAARVELPFSINSYRPAHGRLVSFTQWQVNEKFPAGRFYQASRYLKAEGIELVAPADVSATA